MPKVKAQAMSKREQLTIPTALELSVYNKCLIGAYNAGYQVTTSGQCISPFGKLVGTVGDHGYVRFTHRHEQHGPRRLKVHRLQALQKYGMRVFDENTIVHHSNFDPRDNSANNIVLASRAIVNAKVEQNHNR
jgi:hypothetical protein